MKIYFACSINGGRRLAWVYPKIVALLKEHGTVLSEIFADTSLTAKNGTGGTAEENFNGCMEFIREADYIVAEVTNPSLGVGFEISHAVSLGKPVLCLYNPKHHDRLSSMIEGCPDTKVGYYFSEKDLRRIFEGFFT